MMPRDLMPALVGGVLVFVGLLVAAVVGGA